MYAKIFLKIFDSSIAEDWQCRIVFQDLLILANRDGMVDMTHESIARRTNVPLEIVKGSISKLESPDPKSNTPEDDGRRLERIAGHKDWGWKIINYDRYRAMQNLEQMRAETRERVANWRAQKKRKQQATGNPSPAINVDPPTSTASTQVEVTPPKPKRVFSEKLSTERFLERWNVWQQARRAMKKPKSWEAMFEAQMEFLEQFAEPVAFEVLGASLRNGYQGLFPPKEYENNGRNGGSANSKVVVPVRGSEPKNGF